MEEEMEYAETVEILEDMVRLGICSVKRAKTAADDIYKITDFGIWLGENNLWKEYDNHPERRAALRRMYNAKTKTK